MHGKRSRLFRLIAPILILAATASAIVLTIALLAGWKTGVQFSNGFFIAGTVLAVAGILSVAGGLAQRSSFDTVYSQLAGHASLAERTRRMMDDIDQGYGALILCVGSGLLMILTAMLVGRFSGN